jgi:hypothetical protein
VSAPADTPIDVVFPGASGCATTIHFLTGDFTKTPSHPLTYHSDLPVTVVFTGSAEGCLAEPEFPELGVKADMSGGSATVALGHSFTCSMGVNAGTLPVERRS